MDAVRDADGYYTGPGSVTIQLRTPVKRAGTEDMTAITLNEPTGRQLVQHAQARNQGTDDGIGAMLLLISLVSGISPPDVDGMKQRDVDACASWLELFTKAPPPKSAS